MKNKYLFTPIESIKETIRKEISKILNEKFNYTDDDNPFGDKELTKPFIWIKKIEYLKKKGFHPYENGEDIPEKLIVAKEELDRIKEKKTYEEKRKLEEILDNKRKENEEKYQEYIRKEREFLEKQEEIKRLNKKREKERCELTRQMQEEEREVEQKESTRNIEQYQEYNEEEENDIEIIERDNDISNNKQIRPKYNLKVEMGYDWNKYYQKYYTYENPPPKTIQGYKFKIYFNNLENKKITPYYKIERSNIENTCLLVIKSGKPYKELIFKIVNKEWDMNERSGYRNYYDKGVYYLGFNFKKYRYKR